MNRDLRKCCVCGSFRQVKTRLREAGGDTKYTCVLERRHETNYLCKKCYDRNYKKHTAGQIPESLHVGDQTPGKTDTAILRREQDFRPVEKANTLVNATNTALASYEREVQKKDILPLSLDSTAFKADVKRACQRLRSRCQKRAVLLGQTNSGKSTTLNLLLEATCVPAAGYNEARLKPDAFDPFLMLNNNSQPLDSKAEDSDDEHSQGFSACEEVTKILLRQEVEKLAQNRREENMLGEEETRSRIRNFCLPDTGNSDDDTDVDLNNYGFIAKQGMIGICTEERTRFCYGDVWALRVHFKTTAEIQSDLWLAFREGTGLDVSDDDRREQLENDTFRQALMETYEYFMGEFTCPLRDRESYRPLTYDINGENDFDVFRLHPELRTLQGSVHVFRGVGQDVYLDRLAVRQAYWSTLESAKYMVGDIFVFCPCSVLKDVEIQDVPGTNDPNGRRTHQTYEAIRHADSVLCFISSRGILSDVLEFLVNEAFPKWLQNPVEFSVIFVCVLEKEGKWPIPAKFLNKNYQEVAQNLREKSSVTIREALSKVLKKLKAVADSEASKRSLDANHSKILSSLVIEPIYPMSFTSLQLNDFGRANTERFEARFLRHIGSGTEDTVDDVELVKKKTNMPKLIGHLLQLPQHAVTDIVEEFEVALREFIAHVESSLAMRPDRESAKIIEGHVSQSRAKLNTESIAHSFSKLEQEMEKALTDFEKALLSWMEDSKQEGAKFWDETFQILYEKNKNSLERAMEVLARENEGVYRYGKYNGDLFQLTCGAILTNLPTWWEREFSRQMATSTFFDEVSQRFFDMLQWFLGIQQLPSESQRQMYSSFLQSRRSYFEYRLRLLFKEKVEDRLRKQSQTETTMDIIFSHICSTMIEPAAEIRKPKLKELKKLVEDNWRKVPQLAIDTIANKFRALAPERISSFSKKCRETFLSSILSDLELFRRVPNVNDAPAKKLLEFLTCERDDVRKFRTQMKNNQDHSSGSAMAAGALCAQHLRQRKLSADLLRARQRSPARDVHYFRPEDMDAAQLQANREGYDYFDVQADGHCLFHALASAFIGDPNLHLELRRTLWTFVFEHMNQYYRPFIPAEDLNTYMQRMRNGAETVGVEAWGDEIFLQAFADLYGAGVIVYDPALPFPHTREVRPRNAEGPLEWVRIGFVNGNHFVAVKLSPHKRSKTSQR